MEDELIHQWGIIKRNQGAKQFLDLKSISTARAWLFRVSKHHQGLIKAIDPLTELEDELIHQWNIIRKNQASAKGVTNMKNIQSRTKAWPFLSREIKKYVHCI